MTKIGVLGPKGRLGSWLVSSGAESIECDITNFKELQEALSGKSFDVIINCAAFTSVDDAEKPENQEKVIWANYKALTLILAAIEHKTHLIHISTDYVFGGKRGPYTERMKFSDADRPVNYYGLSKLSAELALAVFPRTTIVRTTGLFGSGEPDFVTSVISHLELHNTMLVADDLYGNQTYVPFLAKQLLDLSVCENKPHLIHLASSDIMSRYQFACCIAEALFQSKDILQPAHSKLIWDVKRPVHGGLDVSLSRKLGFDQYTIDGGLNAYLDVWEGNK